MKIALLTECSADDARAYQKPDVARLDITTERGFAATSLSGATTDELEEDDFGWYL